jgi:hypothetical protein
VYGVEWTAREDISPPPTLSVQVQHSWWRKEYNLETSGGLTRISKRAIRKSDRIMSKINEETK